MRELLPQELVRNQSIQNPGLKKKTQKTQKNRTLTSVRNKAHVRAREFEDGPPNEDYQRPTPDKYENENA